ncbi:MAG TPA: YhcN/YlaJ family sporulation lipoprotein [Oscillospiraceae bacterium]|nr:YhcN/YlaJ family sporulation lipoprotein [Oscillospiraceae bacterium]
MKTKKLVYFLSLLLVASLFVSSCSLFRRPEPERQPVPTPVPDPNLAPNQTPQPNPGVNPPPAPQPQTPREQPPGQPTPDATQMAERIADIATGVQGVDNSVVVVISNMALVGITLERAETAQRGEKELKQEVARRIEDREPSIVNAYVSANPDLVKQLQDISRGIRNGKPISTFFDQITDVLSRMRAESGNNK